MIGLNTKKMFAPSAILRDKGNGRFIASKALEEFQYSREKMQHSTFQNRGVSLKNVIV